MDQNLYEREQEVEDEPDVNHLDVGGLRQVVRHIDEHGGQHKHGYGKIEVDLIKIVTCQINCHNSLKEKWFEKVGGMPDHIQKDSG